MADRLPAGLGWRARAGAGAGDRRRRDLRLGRGIDLGGAAAEAGRAGRVCPPARRSRRRACNPDPRFRTDPAPYRRVPSAGGRSCRARRTRPSQLRSQEHSEPRPDGAENCDMKTEFSLAQLADPDIAEADKILRACVHCGFCTATCPTYVLLGDELDSPRGRIYLIKEMLEKDRPPTGEVVKHIDRCLSCLACMTTCPSGVNYMHLVDQARVRIERDYSRPLTERLLRAVLAFVLPRPQWFRASMWLARLGQPFAALLPTPRTASATPTLLRRIKAMLALAPGRLPAPGPAGGSVFPA